MENDNHEIYGNPRNTGRRGLQVEAKTKSLLWPHSIGIRGPHSSNTKKKGLKRPTLAWNEMSFVTSVQAPLSYIATIVLIKLSVQAPLSYIATIVRIELSVQAPLSYIATIVLIKLSVQAPLSYIATIVRIELSVQAPLSYILSFL